MGLMEFARVPNPAFALASAGLNRRAAAARIPYIMNEQDHERRMIMDAG
jgi:hypothetical protein